MTTETVVERQSPGSRSVSGSGGVGLAKLADSLQMLCERNRMRILCFLMQGERGVCDLAECLDLPQNLVSHHLSVLRERGLVRARRGERDARCIYYSVDRLALAQLNALYMSFFTPERDGPWHMGCCSGEECCSECHATRSF